MKGFNTHRHKQNPIEKKLHDKFIEDFVMNDHGTDDNNNAINQLVFGVEKGSKPKDYLTDREKTIVISTIQWLGSPVGQGFLKECGFELKEKKS